MEMVQLCEAMHTRPSGSHDRPGQAIITDGDALPMLLERLVVIERKNHDSMTN